MSLGKTLKALRQKKSLNQKDLSSLSGVSQATISRIETGRVHQLRSAALKNLADALGVTVDFMMGDPQVFAEIPTIDDLVETGVNIPEFREERFRQIADSLDPLALHENGRVLYVNQSMADMLGYRKEELLGYNGIKMAVATQSHPVVQRMINSRSSDAYEVLLVRKDGSIFPAKVLGRSIREDVRLSLAQDITEQRCQQAVMRIQHSGLEADSMSDLTKIVRILSDEINDMGQQFEAVSLHVIDEARDLLTSHYALPESRGYRSSSEVMPLQKSLDQYTPIRGLISHWRRNKLWERESDDAFFQMVSDSALGAEYKPSLLIDVPFEMGSMGIGLSEQSGLRRDVLVDVLKDLSKPISRVINRLAQLQQLRDQLEEHDKYIGA